MKFTMKLLTCRVHKLHVLFSKTYDSQVFALIFYNIRKFLQGISSRSVFRFKIGHIWKNGQKQLHAVYITELAKPYSTSELIYESLMAHDSCKYRFCAKFLLTLYTMANVPLLYMNNSIDPRIAKSPSYLLSNKSNLLTYCNNFHDRMG